MSEDREIEVGPRGLRARNYDLVSVGLFCAIIFIAYFLYDQLQEFKFIAASTASTIKQFTDEEGKARSEMICILALPQEERLKQLFEKDSLCKRIARGLVQ